MKDSTSNKKKKTPKVNKKSSLIRDGQNTLNIRPRKGMASSRGKSKGSNKIKNMTVNLDP